MKGALTLKGAGMSSLNGRLGELVMQPVWQARGIVDLVRVSGHVRVCLLQAKFR